MLDTLADAIEGKPVTHDARWGAANLEVGFAMIAASECKCEVTLPARAACAITLPEAVVQRAELVVTGS